VKKKIYFVLGEHKSFQGVKSFYDILIQILKEYDVLISRRLQPKAINILVENFSEKDFVQIKKLKEESSFKIILVTTEFFNHKINSFNSFDINVKKLFINFFFARIYLAITIPWQNIKSLIKRFLITFFRLNIKKYRILKKKTFGAIFPEIKENTRIKAIKDLLDTYFRYFYFKKRYKYFNKIIPYADLVMASHQEIYNECKKIHDKTFYVFPKISKFKPNKNVKKSNFFKFSGYMGKDRKFFFKTFYEKLEDNLFINKNGLIFLKNFLKKIVNTKANSFIDISKKNKYKFSLHPQREKIWRFSSPIRYIDALNNGEIPIVFKNFNDKISKNLSILVNIKSKKSLQKLEVNSYYSNLKKLKKGINEYNSFVARDNIRFKSELKKLIKENYKYYTNCS